MEIPGFTLPEDMETLRAFALAMAQKAGSLEAENADLKTRNADAEVRLQELVQVHADAEERIKNLTSILKIFSRARFGRKSEKLRRIALTDDQQAELFDEIATGIAELETLVKKAGASDKPKRTPRPRKVFPAHLERVEQTIEPEALLEHEGKTKVLIRVETSERLDVVRAKFRVMVTHRPIYAFKGEDGVVQAKAPPHIIEGGIPTEALLAQVAVSKYADGLPLYRQEAIYARDKVEISRGLMAQWMGAVGFELIIISDYILEQIKKAERIFADETTLPTLTPGTGKARKCYLWAYAKDDRPFGGSGPILVAFRFEDSRAGDCVANHLDGYNGIVQVDGYNGYNSIAPKGAANSGAVLAGCWAHLRRKFYDLHVSDGLPVATSSVDMMKALWQVEDDIRGRAPEIRAKARQENSAKVVADVFRLWEATLPRISGKSKLANAIRYGLKRREAFEVFLHNGLAEIDSNIVERAIRPQTIIRKNSLFAGNDGGGRTWATIATVLQTCKMNDVDPQAWLTQTLERLANGWPISQLQDLMPWNFKTSGIG
jgi:transposase